MSRRDPHPIRTWAAEVLEVTPQAVLERKHAQPDEKAKAEAISSKTGERERQERKTRIDALVERLVASTLPKPQPRTKP